MVPSRDVTLIDETRRTYKIKSKTLTPKKKKENLNDFYLKRLINNKRGTLSILLIKTEDIKTSIVFRRDKTLILILF